MMNKWSFRIDAKLACYVPYALAAFSAAYSVIICLVFAREFKAFERSTEYNMPWEVFIVTDLVLPLFMLFSVLLTFSGDFSGGTDEFLRTLPVRNIPLISARFFRMAGFCCVCYLAVLTCVYFAAEKCGYAVNFANLALLTFPNEVFAGALAMFVIAVVGNIFFATAFTCGYFIVEIMSHGIFSKSLLLFINLYGQAYSIRQIERNRIFYLAASAVLCAATVLILKYRAYFKSRVKPGN